MSFLVSDAMAAASTTAAGQPDSSFSLLMIVGIFVLFYFMLIRPQNRRAKEQREMVKQLQKGDEIVTAGGILARVASLDDQFMKVELAEGMEVMIQRNAVTAVLPKGTIKSL